VKHERVGWGARGLFRSRQLFPQLEAFPDISRGEQRLAAEVALAELRGCITPTYAHERAVAILNVLARA
jgi:hypothetical protein